MLRLKTKPQASFSSYCVDNNTLYQGDWIEVMLALMGRGVRVNTCLTSPPYYGLRTYEVKGQVGLEETPEKYIEGLVLGFRLVRELLSDDGTLWINIGDSFLNKGQIGVPWRLVFALKADGWFFVQENIWHKLNPRPEPAPNRCVVSHEPIFMFAKSQDYFFDNLAVEENAISFATSKYETRNKRSVWSMPTQHFEGEHFASFPTKLAETPILAGTSAHGHCPKCGKGWQQVIEKEKRNYTRHTMTRYQVYKLKFKGGGDQGKYLGPRKREVKGWEPTCKCEAGDPVPGIVLDPFAGSGTVGVVAWKHHRHSVLIELNADYVEMARKRLAGLGPLFSTG